MLTTHGGPCSLCMEVHADYAWRPWDTGLRLRAPRRRPVMLTMIGGGKHCQPTGARGRYPARRLHLVDIENLAGAAVPSLGQVREVQGLYARRLAFGALDQVVIGSSHLTLLNAALGWPHARYRVRSGPDGADLELLDVMLCENV